MKTANSCGFEKGVLRIGLHIGDMDRPAFKNCPANNGPSADLERVSAHEFVELGRVTEIGNLSVHITLLPID
jgi:hypothetical protein